jgi:hypothetical protein
MPQKKYLLLSIIILLAGLVSKNASGQETSYEIKQHR